MRVEAIKKRMGYSSQWDLCKTPLIVIPAKAGIQETIDNTGFRSSRLCRNVFAREYNDRSNLVSLWILRLPQRLRGVSQWQMRIATQSPSPVWHNYWFYAVMQRSHIKVTTTPERRFAMTNEDCDTVSFAGMTKLVVLCGHAKLLLCP